jgi:hypothetical protein
MGRTGWILLAAVLLITGVGALFVEGISYVTRDTVLDLGALEVTAERQERIGLPIWASFVLIAAGAGALLAGAGVKSVA